MSPKTALALTIIGFLAPMQAALAAPWTPADAGERVWLDWWAQDVPAGPISSWTSRGGAVNATQGTVVNQPTKQADEVFFGNAQRLQFPTQNSANVAHRAVVILFRIDLTGSGDGSIFTVNGVSGGAERQPMVSYDRTANKVKVYWQTPGNVNHLAFSVAEDPNQWHCLVSRRVNNVHYASLDGKQVDGVTPGESQITMADWAVPKQNTNPIGYLGDFRPSTPPMAIDSVILLQDEMTREEAEKFMGWAMWRRGAQTQLPSSHPYRITAPQSSPTPNTFVESTQAEYDAIKAFWDDTTQSEANKGQPVNTAGWNVVFEDEFNTHSVTDDVRGRGNWFAPTHGDATGAAISVKPTVNTADLTVGGPGTPATYIHNGSSMTIRMQQDGANWKSGAFCSVNANGYGRTWMYPYVEARMKIGNSSTGNTKGAWPALWLKSRNFFFRLTESNMEYDIYEGYNSDPMGFHNSYHNWPAQRKLPGRLQTHRWMSNYLGLKTSTGGWHENVNLFDNQWHTYGVMVTPTWVINIFDGREMFRFPTPVEMKQPLWTLVDLAMHRGEVTQASGIYELEIDYIRVSQNPTFTPVPLVEYKFNETGTSATSTGTDTTPVQLFNALSSATDLHGSDGTGVSGQPTDRALDLTLATGMGNGYTGPFGKHAADNDNIDALKSFTVTGWMKTANSAPLANGAHLVRQEGTTNGPGYFVVSDSTTGKLVCNVDSTTAACIASYATTQQWVFFAVTYDGTQTVNNVKFYVGSPGSAVNLTYTNTINRGTVDENTAPLYIGNRPGADRPFDGYLDNIRIYGSKADTSGALTPAQLEILRARDVSAP